jgi:PKD repeat protein
MISGKKLNKKVISLVCSAALLLPALPMPAVFASVINVTAFGANGTDEHDDLAGIQAAIDSASAGETVYIPAGTYFVSDSIESKSDVNLAGESRDTTIIKYTGESVGYLLSLNGRSRVEVSQLTLDGNGNANADGGITADDTLAAGSGGHQLHHNRIINMTREEGFGPFGILVAHTDNVVITDNDFSNMGLNSTWGAGMRVGYDSNYPVILRNTIADTGRGGIFLNDGVEGAVVRHNIVTGSGHKDHGLSIELHTNVNYSLVEDNQVDHWLSVVRSEYNAIRRNTIQTSGDTVKGMGLEIMSNHSVTSDNLVDGGQQVGMQQSPGTGYQYWGYNTIQNLVMWGMQLQGEGTGEIEQNQYFYKNIFQQTQTGHPSVAYPGYDGYGLRIHGSSRNITFDSNVIRNNGGKAIDITGAAGVDRISFINNVITGNAGPTIETYPDAAVDLEWSGNTVSGNGTDTQLESRGFADPKPTAEFEAPLVAEAGQPVYFSNGSSGNGGTIVEHLWDFGDGLPSTEINPSYTYNEPGDYRVTLVVWSDLGRASLKEQIIRVQGADAEAPSAPSGLTVTSKSETSVGLSWTAATDNVGVAGYEVYEGTRLAGTASGETAYVVTGLNPGTAYSFTVVAKDAAGHVSAPSIALEVTTNSSIPTTPSGPSATSVPGSSTTGEQTITREELVQPGSGDKVVIAVKGGVNKISLPADAGEALTDRQLELKWDAIAVTIPSATLKQLAELTDQAGVKGGSIVLNVQILTASEEEALLAKAEEMDSLSIKALGSVYDFTLALRKADGQLLSLPAFISPIGLRVKAEAAGNQSTAGIYEIADNGKLTYAGGAAANGEVSGAAYHFSKYAALEVSRTFQDVPKTHWAYATISELASKLIIQGTSPAAFEPKREVTRAEFIVMLMHALGAGGPQGDALQLPEFSDRNLIGLWAEQAVAQAAQAGLISGYGDGSFRPQATISRAEMAVIIAKARGTADTEDGAPTFTDSSAIPEWARQASAALAQQGILKGRAGGEFDPQASLTRAEAAMVIAAILNAVN